MNTNIHPNDIHPNEEYWWRIAAPSGQADYVWGTEKHLDEYLGILNADADVGTYKYAELVTDEDTIARLNRGQHASIIDCLAGYRYDQPLPIRTADGSLYINTYKTYDLYAIESGESYAAGVWAFDDRVTDRTPDDLRWVNGELANDCSEGVEGPFASVAAAIEWIEQSERELAES